MKSWTRYLTLTLCCLGCALLAYLATAAVGADGDLTDVRRLALYDWLELSPAQRAEIDQDDPTFFEQSADLAKQLGDHRATLADLITETASTDEQIIQQLDRVIDVEVKLEKRVAQFVLVARHRLNSAQRQRLVDAIATGLRDNAGDHITPEQGNKAR